MLHVQIKPRVHSWIMKSLIELMWSDITESYILQDDDAVNMTQ